MSLPFCLPPLPTAAEMARWDKTAVSLGLPEMLLMENAAREALHVLEEESGPLRGKRVLLYMGAGKNGGDAACLARHLKDQGAEPLVLHTRPPGSRRGVTAKHLRAARACAVPFLSAFAPAGRRPARLRRPDIIVDGLLGTGFTGQLRPELLELVEEINAQAEQAFIFALDIPSGLDSRRGLPCPQAVRARVTVCFEALKPGMALPEAAAFTGRLRVRRIGIPASAMETDPPSFRLLDESCAHLFPAAAPGAHKGSFGRVLVLGGSQGLTGAVHLAAAGALRTGSGLVGIAAPGGLCAEIRAGLPDVISFPLGQGTSWREVPAGEAAEKILSPELGADALVVGPGMGRDPAAGEFLAALLRLPHRPPLVLDADALTLLAAGAAPLEAVSEKDIFTPHPGEAGALLHTDARRVQEDRFAALRDLCGLHPGIWVLKGSGTLIGQRGQPALVTPHHAPCLAVGGSGDVLAGCVGSLLGQGLSSLTAAALGVLLHARAGALLEEEFPARGNSAGEIARALPRAKALLVRQNHGNARSRA